MTMLSRFALIHNSMRKIYILTRKTANFDSNLGFDCKFFSSGKKINRKSKWPLTLIGGFAVGSLFLYSTSLRKPEPSLNDRFSEQLSKIHAEDKQNTPKQQLDPSLDIDLQLDMNEIYEKCATVFLSNPELREIIGMPIKVTSFDTETDQIRSVTIRRESGTLYAFIAYALQGSTNSGVVYCKLKLSKENGATFKTETSVLKLYKPDLKGRTEIAIKMKGSSVTKSTKSN